MGSEVNRCQVALAPVGKKRQTKQPKKGPRLMTMMIFTPEVRRRLKGLTTKATAICVEVGGEMERDYCTQ